MPGDIAAQSAGAGVGEDDEAAGGEAQLPRRGSVGDSLDRGQLDEVVAAARGAELAAEDRVVGRRAALRRLVRLRLQLGEARERVGHAIDGGQSARAVAPDRRQQRRGIGLGQRRPIGCLAHPPLQRVAGEAGGTQRDEPGAAARVSADQSGIDVIAEGEGGADGNAATRVQVRLSDGATAVFERSHVGQLIDGRALHPDRVAREDGGVRGQGSG